MQKFNVNLSDNVHGVLDDLADRLDMPMADVVRDSLSLFWYLAREVKDGNKLLVQRGDQVSELMIPSLEPLRSNGLNASGERHRRNRNSRKAQDQKLASAPQ